MELSVEELSDNIAERLKPLIASAATPQEVFTVEEAATYLRLSKDTLNHWRMEGIGPKYSKIGKRVLYKRKDLDTFLNAHSKSTSEQR